MNAKKFFLIIGLLSLVFGLLIGTVFGLFQPDNKDEAKQEQTEDESAVANHVEDPNQATPTEEKEESEQEPPSSEEIPNHTHTQRLSAEDAAEIARSKTNGGEIKKVEFKKKDDLSFYKVELKKDGKKAKLEIDAYTGDILSVKVKD